ncbi:hypothetical protein pb186bvf_007057 [Paramecium bursaria]
MYSARSKDSKLRKNFLEVTLDNSYYSNKSKKEQDQRSKGAITPEQLTRPTSATTTQFNSKVKLMLNQLVSHDKTSNQLFTQNLTARAADTKPKLKETESTKNIKPSYQGKFQFQLYKQQNLVKDYRSEKTQKSEKIDNQSTNRDSSVESKKSSLYYMFQNKQSDPQLKSNKSQLLTLSQLANQFKSDRQSNNTTPQRQLNQKNQNYVEQIKLLKQQLDLSQRKPSPNIEKPQINQQLLKNLNHQIVKQKQQTQTTNQTVTASVDDIYLSRLFLQKEQHWNQLLLQEKNLKLTELSQQCSNLKKLIQELSEKQNSEYLYRLDPHIIDSILLESMSILVMTIEYIKLDQIPDHNLKNLILYVNQSNLQTLIVLNEQLLNEQITQRIELRLCINRKIRGKQCLQKNNYIIRSLLELIIDDTTRPDIYSQLGFNINSLDLFLSQQKQILAKISQEIPQKQLESNESLLSFEKKSPQQLLPLRASKPYTLVLDLDETLVHYQEFPNGGGQFIVRPFAQEFLTQISQYYEIVIFTAAMPDYANFIIDILDEGQKVAARLYREHTVLKDNVYIKDLSILGRPLNRTIIVDNMPENFQLQPENGIFIQGWYGEQKDRALKDLQPLLEEIAIKKVKDVRVALNCFREQMIQRVQQGIKNPYLNLQLN